jgi:hypothetical protein
VIGLPAKRHLIFRVVWRGVNLLLVAVLVSSLYAGVREYSVRRYLDGFSDAIVPNSMPEEQKLQAILDWMRAEPSRATSTDLEALAKRDPVMTLTYIAPGWEEAIDWSLLLERESFFYLVLA